MTIAPVNARKAWVRASLAIVELSARNNDQQLNQLSPQLRKLRQNGIDGISLPVHWRMLAPFSAQQLEQEQTWQPIQRLTRHLLKHGFRVQFELFFASDRQSKQTTLLPDWAWFELAKQKPKTAAEACVYLDSHGLHDSLAMAPWAGLALLKLQMQWMQSFAKHMQEFAAKTAAINLALGPNGESRYPCYERESQGRFQSFSPAALAELTQDMSEQYGSAKAWHKAWGIDSEQLEQSLLGALNSALASQQASTCLEEYSLWYAMQWQRYVGQMLNKAASSFGGDWRDVPLSLNLPVMEAAAADHPWKSVFSGLNPQPWAERKDQQQYQVTQLERWQQQAMGRLLLIFNGGESAQAMRSKHPLLSAQRELRIPALVQNLNAKALANHPGWDQLYRSVLRHEGVIGWVFNDMSQLEEQAIVKGRLAQLNKFKYQEAQTRQLAAKQFRVMGPLHLKVANQKQMLEEENWQEFEAELRQLRRIGVTAVSTDIWWGLVEGDKPGKFDWSYYDRVVNLLKQIGLQWVPILSFHQAGGNVNDDFMQAIPLWLWGRLLESHDELNSVQDLQYVSETGDASMEYVSHWADDYVMPYYQRFMQAFADHYANHASLMDEINVSLGPAGELRYPSYNAHDWGNYPNRGTLQCYSRLAQKDWLAYLKQRFHSISALNASFGSTHNRFEDVSMPSADWVFEHKHYIHNAWAREFLTWYHKALVKHGRRIVELALEVFDEKQFGNADLGIKIPGIHWVVSDPEIPRTAEITAGLIKVHPTLNSSNQQEYLRLLKGLIPEGSQSRLAVHFTCLEMINKDYEGYSRAADLVDWMADAAEECQVSLMGENALAGELYGEQGWRQMARALKREPGYDGLTLLRMQNFFDDDPTPLKELQKLINQC